MAASSIIAFWGVSFLLVIVPGADWAYAIAAGLRDRTVMPAASGLMLGYIGLTVVVAGGVAAIVTRHPEVLTVLTVVGAAYLVWLGVTTLAKPGPLSASADVSERAAWWTRLLKGAGVSGVNPKGLLLFLALLPQFTDANGTWPLAMQIGVLGLAHTLSCGVVYSGVGVTSRTVLKSRPAMARAVTRFSGSAMTLIGLSLLAERAIPLFT